MLPQWCLGPWRERRPEGEGWWDTAVLPRVVPHLGRGEMQFQVQNEPENDHLLGQRKRRHRHKGVGFLLPPFFFSGGIQCDEFSARASATL